MKTQILKSDPSSIFGLILKKMLSFFLAKIIPSFKRMKINKIKKKKAFLYKMGHSSRKNMVEVRFTNSKVFEVFEPNISNRNIPLFVEVECKAGH